MKRWFVFVFCLTAITGCLLRDTVPLPVRNSGKLPLKVAVILPNSIEWDGKFFGGGWKGDVNLYGKAPADIGNMISYYYDGQNFGNKLIGLSKSGFPYLFNEVDFYNQNQTPEGYHLILKLVKPRVDVKIWNEWQRKEYAFTYKEGYFTKGMARVKMECIVMDGNGNKMYKAVGVKEFQDETEDYMTFDLFVKPRLFSSTREGAFQNLVADINKWITPYLNDNCLYYASSKDDFYPKLDELANDVKSYFYKNSGKRVAVPDFGDLDGKITEFGKFLGMELGARLVSKDVNMVERTLLDKALAELKLSKRALFNGNGVAQIGNLTGAEIILTGTIADTGGGIRINARLIEIQTGNVLWTGGMETTKTVAICKMMRVGI